MTLPKPDPSREPITPGFQGTASEWREIAEILAFALFDQERHLTDGIATNEMMIKGASRADIDFKIRMNGCLSAQRTQLSRIRTLDIRLANSVMAWMES